MARDQGGKNYLMNFGEFADWVANYGKGFGDACARGIRKAAPKIIRELKAAARRVRPKLQNTEAFINGWKSYDIPDGVAVFNATPEAVWIERGRTAGPVNGEGIAALAEWAQRVLGLDEKEAKSAAFAIAKKLEEEGYKPRHFLHRRLPKLKYILLQTIASELGVPFYGPNPPEPPDTPLVKKPRRVRGETAAPGSPAKQRKPRDPNAPKKPRKPRDPNAPKKPQKPRRKVDDE